MPWHFRNPLEFYHIVSYDNLPPGAAIFIRSYMKRQLDDPNFSASICVSGYYTEDGECLWSDDVTEENIIGQPPDVIERLVNLHLRSESEELAAEQQQQQQQADGQQAGPNNNSNGNGNGNGNDTDQDTDSTITEDWSQQPTSPRTEFEEPARETEQETDEGDKENYPRFWRPRSESSPRGWSAFAYFSNPYKPSVMNPWAGQLNQEQYPIVRSVHFYTYFAPPNYFPPKTVRIGNPPEDGHPSHSEAQKIY
ncbi:hypothetical protein ESCO_002773 [Escovopsis weberi]|uniref:Uncharacterized protein n=1 Tax=Escovopsis weberi TaxID=150374 RepID=A0A0M8N018_ESCWE|nr:hypothetical protein ESCO_002773 [Escovopsis weberi]